MSQVGMVRLEVTDLYDYQWEYIYVIIHIFCRRQAMLANDLDPF